MVVNYLIDKLKIIGLSEYEAKAYLALLRENPGTAYEIARSSGLPTSKIYQIIDKLQSRGLIQALMSGKKKRYIPKQPQEFIKNERHRIQSNFDSLEEDLAQLHQKSQVSYIWNILDYGFFIEKAKQMINESKNEIMVSLWDEELIQLNDILIKAGDRKINIAAVNFGKSKIVHGVTFHHPIEDTLYNERGGRGITLVADGIEALTGTVFKDNIVEGAWSNNRGFVLMAEDYFKHDVYIMKIVSRFDDLLLSRFGDNYHLLRDVFSDREVNHEGL